MARKFSRRLGVSQKCAAIEQLGAKAINYREEDFTAVIAEATGGQGVDMVLDMVGAPYMARNLQVLARGGRLVQIAFLAGQQDGEFRPAAGDGEASDDYRLDHAAAHGAG